MDRRTATTTALITTSAGTFSAERTNAVTSVRGIRFATAPRFEPSVIVEPVDGIVPAIRPGPVCPQIPTALDRLLSAGEQHMSEDCLNLDVHTPAADDARRPVIVWIHGGAFVTGSGSMGWYDGAQLARYGDLVVVSINYRLGVFGFAGTADLGLVDQLRALEWVQRHIASFGGDPDRVTILGESAGGASVIALMAAEASSGLFSRAWAMSPSITQIRSAPRAHDALAEILGHAGADDLETLALSTVEDLLRAQAKVLETRSTALTAFAPTLQGAVIESLTAAIADPRPLVVGTTRDEMHLFTAFDAEYSSIGPDQLRARVAHHFADPDQALAAYRRHRREHSMGQLLSAVQTDLLFRSPATRVVADRSRAGAASWLYWFTMPTPAFGGLLGSCHGLDIPYIFRNLEQSGVEMFTGSADDRWMVADQISGDLIEFATSARAPWAGYDTTARTVRNYDVIPSDLRDPEPELRELWEA